MSEKWWTRKPCLRKHKYILKTDKHTKTKFFLTIHKELKTDTILKINLFANYCCKNLYENKIIFVRFATMIYNLVAYFYLYLGLYNETTIKINLEIFHLKVRPRTWFQFLNLLRTFNYTHYKWKHVASLLMRSTISCRKISNQTCTQFSHR